MFICVFAWRLWWRFRISGGGGIRAACITCGAARNNDLRVEWNESSSTGVHASVQDALSVVINACTGVLFLKLFPFPLSRLLAVIYGYIYAGLFVP